MGLFINGLPVFTFELEEQPHQSRYTSDAVWQYKKDRNPPWGEKLFEFGRCVAHFALDESEVMFCTHLKGKASWFLPFNRGWNDGARQPAQRARPFESPMPPLAEVLTRESLTNILENFAQVVEEPTRKDGQTRKTGRKTDLAAV